MASQLSVLCMVRDEVEPLRRALASVREVADEIVVVSTGGNPGVSLVAAEANAQFIPYAWDDDFSAPLNLGLEQVRCRWVLRIDADEELVPPNREYLAGLLAREDVLLSMVRRQEMPDPQAPPPPVALAPVEMYQARLWRADQGLRYRGRYHEHFHKQARKIATTTGLRITECDLVLRHWGHRRSTVEAKLRRGAHHMELELRDRPGQLYYEIELGRTWFRLGDPRGRPLLEQALGRVLEREGDPEPPSMLVGPLLDLCFRTWDLLPEDRRRLEGLAGRWFPHSPPLLDARAAHAFDSGDFGRAARYYERLVRLAESGAYDRSTPFEARLLGDEPLLRLAVCHHRQANWGQAERLYRRLLERFPDHPAATANLRVLEAQRRVHDPTLTRHPKRTRRR